jgi:transmembrane sensor
LKNNDQHIEDIIGKILSQEMVTVSEKEILNQWLSEDEENRKYFENLKQIFSDSAHLRNKKTVNSDLAWEKMQAQMKNIIPEQPVKIIDINTFLRVAAMFLITLGLGITVYLIAFNNVIPVTMASGNSTREIKLPDGSSIFLNKNSTVTYTYSDDQREVKLSGEAYFDVIHDEEKPFVVKAGELEIVDIGTAFNIKTDPSAKVIDVSVESGEVAVTTPDKTTLHLIQGEKSVYHQTSKTIAKSKVQANELAYKTKVFVFENASLEVAVQKLNEVYGTNIVLSEELKSCHITSTFKNEKINSILDIIGETLHLKVIRKENEILLEGNACDE